LECGDASPLSIPWIAFIESMKELKATMHRRTPRLSQMAFDEVVAAIRPAIASRQIGTPVAARIVVNAVADADDIPPLLAKIVTEACDALGSPPQTLWASGDVRAGHWTVLLRLAAGQSLIVSVGTRTTEIPIIEVVVFGNHGILSCEGGSAATTEEAIGLNTAEAERRLLAGVRLAIQTRQAVVLESTGPVAAAGSDQAANDRPTFDLFAKSTRRPIQPPYGLLLVAGDHTHQFFYADAFLSDKRCKLVGVTDEHPTPDRQVLNERLANRMGTRILPDFREAISRPDVHIVSICAEPERRAPLIVAAAEAGRHLYLDKPLCTSVTQASEIVAAIRKNKVLAQMFSQVLWDPATRVRQLVESGELGELQAIHCDLCFAKGHTGTAKLGQPRRESTTPNQFELPDAKRELTNIGVYGVVLLLWLLRRNVRRVFAATGNYFFAEHQSHDMEDFGQMLLELDGGITASITAGRTGWRSHPSGGLHRVYLVGSRRTAIVDAHRPRIEVWSDSERWTPPPRDPDDPLSMWAPLPNSAFRAQPKVDWFTPTTNQWSTDTGRFLDALEHGREGEITVELAAAATEVLSAAYRSAATSRVVPLPLDSTF
jgi:predicted dehydrogenase